ncbi:hypothetical protein V6N13_039807 [Hibiscus sabdariffa]
MERIRRHISTSELCGICGGGQEDVEHVLRSCVVAKGLWMRALPPEARRRCRLLLDSKVGVMDVVLVHGNRLVVECSRVARAGKGARAGRVLSPSWCCRHSAMWGRNMDMNLTNFILSPTDIASLVKEDERGSSPTIATPMLVAPEVPFDPVGVGGC